MAARSRGADACTRRGGGDRPGSPWTARSLIRVRMGSWLLRAPAPRPEAQGRSLNRDRLGRFLVLGPWSFGLGSCQAAFSGIRHYATVRCFDPDEGLTAIGS